MSLNGTLKALSDPIRRNILTMLKGKKMIAGDIAEELGISPASLSYLLNLLKKNDLVNISRWRKMNVEPIFLTQKISA